MFVVRFFICAHWLLVVGRFAEGSFHEIGVAAAGGGGGEQGGAPFPGCGREWPGMVYRLVSGNGGLAQVT